MKLSSLAVSFLVKASDPILRLALEKYHREGLTTDEKISSRLWKEYSIEMKYVSHFQLLEHALTESPCTGATQSNVDAKSSVSSVLGMQLAR